MAEWQKSQNREETVDSHNPPNAVVDHDLRKTPAFAVVGMWYYLAPVAVVVLVIVMAMLFWNSRKDVNEGAVPTTGMEQTSPAHQNTPGGRNPAPRPDSTQDEIKYRGKE